MSSNPKQQYGDLKLPVHLVPPSAIAYLGMAFAEGARKYGAYNFRETKVESMTYIGAAQRHLLAMLDGEWIDSESGNPHAAHLMACIAILVDAYERDALIDNRPASGNSPDIMAKYAERKKAQKAKVESESALPPFVSIEEDLKLARSGKTFGPTVWIDTAPRCCQGGVMWPECEKCPKFNTKSEAL